MAKLDDSLLTFSTSDAAGLSGATLRQLQVWHERAWIPGVRVAGHRRAWKWDHIRRAAVLARLSKSGQRDVGPKVAAIRTSVFRNRFMLFTPGADLICATNETSAALKAASASRHPVIVVDLNGCI